MAVRAGKDMLETFDSDDGVSLLAASNAGSTEEQTAHELTQSPPIIIGTTDLESPLAPSPDLGIDIAIPLEQSPQKKRRRPFSKKPSLDLVINIATTLGQPQKSDRDLSRVTLSSFHVCEASSHVWTAKTEERINSNRSSQRLEIA